ncbi:adenine specific methyltransferase mboiiA [Caudoviricetes sp.]|nr:adenine specific methyltransferase mboiiA [Caudoviricetes sp.]
MKSLFVSENQFDATPYVDSKKPLFTSEYGALFRGDCREVLRSVKSETVDTVFADPPFNLGKEYGGDVNDKMGEDDYLPWCHERINECVRVLKPGGAFFLYNLPKWNIPLGNTCQQRVTLLTQCPHERIEVLRLDQDASAASLGSCPVVREPLFLAPGVNQGL